MKHHIILCNLCGCQCTYNEFNSETYLFSAVSLVKTGATNSEFTITPEITGDVQVCHRCLFALKKLLKCPVPEGV